MDYFAAPLLADSAKNEFDLLFKGGQKKNYKKNVVVISEGESSSSFYLVKSGRVKVFLDDEQGKEIVLSVLGPGEYFGEMSLIDDEARSAGVTTLEDCALVVISRENFRKALLDNPDLSFQIMLGLSKKLRAATKKIGSLALMDVYGRVANTLLGLASEQDGTLVVEQRLTHQEIANMVGASREMVTRIFGDLLADGYISYDHKKRIVLNEK